MNDIRARFEEIWPVPDVIFWSSDIGRYAPMPDEVLQYERLNEQWANEHNSRLDTFTRCQETTSIHLSLIDELVQYLQWYVDEDEIHEGDPENKYWVDGKHEAEALLERVKQITGEKE